MGGHFSCGSRGGTVGAVAAPISVGTGEGSSPLLASHPTVEHPALEVATSAWPVRLSAGEAVPDGTVEGVERSEAEIGDGVGSREPSRVRQTPSERNRQGASVVELEVVEVVWRSLSGSDGQMVT
jgi:hypothetical protein